MQRNSSAPKNVRSVRKSLKDLAGGIYGGLTGVVYDHASVQEGWLKGAATGLAGLVEQGQTSSRCADMLTHTFQGIKNSANMFDKQKRFMRYRCAFSRGFLRGFQNWAEGQAYPI